MLEQTDKPTEKIYYDQRSVALRTKQVACFVQEHDKITMLDLIMKNHDNTHSVIVVKSKSKADKLSKFLLEKDMKVLVVHGNHRAEQQAEVADKFNRGSINIIITTDMILQTLDLKDIKLMISYDLPLIVQDYFNRLAYMKELGEAVAFVNPEDDKALSAIEFNMKQEIEEKEVEGFISTPIPQGKRLGRKIKDYRKKPRHRKVKAKKIEKDNK